MSIVGRAAGGGGGITISLRHIVSALAFYLLFAAPASAARITLHDAEVSGRMLRLGDVATITEATAAEKENLAAIGLGFAPPAGSRRAIPLDTIRMHVLATGVDPRTVVFEGRSPFVSREGQTLDGALLAEKVSEVVRNRFPEVDIELARLPEAIVLPLGDVEIAVEVPSRITPSFFANAEAVAGGEAVRFFVSFKAVKTEEVAVATRLIERGSVITERDVAVRRVDTLGGSRRYVRSLADAVGRAAKRTLAEGAPLTAEDVEAVRLVDRGDHVTIIVRSGGLTISAPGEAFAPGGLGETVRVRNIESKKILTGRVSGPGEVTIVQ